MYCSAYEFVCILGSSYRSQQMWKKEQQCQLHVCLVERLQLHSRWRQVEERFQSPPFGTPPPPPVGRSLATSFRNL